MIIEISDGVYFCDLTKFYATKTFLKKRQKANVVIITCFHFGPFVHGTHDHWRVDKSDSIVLHATDKASGTVEIIFQHVQLCRTCISK